MSCLKLHESSLEQLPLVNHWYISLFSVTAVAFAIAFSFDWCSTRFHRIEISFQCFLFQMLLEHTFPTRVARWFALLYRILVAEGQRGLQLF